MCAFFEPFIIATYGEGAWSYFRVHSFMGSFGKKTKYRGQSDYICYNKFDIQCIPHFYHHNQFFLYENLR